MLTDIRAGARTRRQARTLTGTADAEIERAKSYGRAVKADRTIAEYARDWRAFERYCRARGLSALPADPPTVARYAATLAGVRAIATDPPADDAISQAHQESPPTAHKVVREVLADIARTNGSAQRKKSALTHCRSVARGALLTIDEATLKGKRDRALLLLGFAGPLRRLRRPQRKRREHVHRKSQGETVRILRVSRATIRRASPVGAIRPPVCSCSKSFASSRPRTLRFSVTPT